MLKNKKKLTIIIIIALLVVGFFLFKKPEVVTVRDLKAENIEVRKTISASGITVSKSESDLAFSASGSLQGIYVEKGDKVLANTLVGSIYNYDTSQSSKSLKDSRDVAIRDLDIYKQNYEDNKDAVGGEEEYALNVRRLQELIDRAEASYQSSLGTLSKTYLYAPFTGTVVDVYFDIGEQVTAGQSVIKLADLDNLEFDISIDQEDFGILSLNQDVEISLDSYSDKIFKGKVIELPKYVNNTTEEFEVKISVEQMEEFPVLLGMKGDASIIVDTTKNQVTALPFDAVITEDDKHFIWVNDNGVLKKQYVEIGLEGDIYTEIKTDISSFKLVSPVKNNVQVSEGLKIKVLEE